MNSFDATHRAYIVAKKRAATASAKANEAYSLLESARRDLGLTCACGVSSRIGDLELIHEEFNGRVDYNDDYVCQTREYWVCPNCEETNRAPDPDEVHFQAPVSRYFKQVHAWDSDRERCHGRVLDLLGTSLKRASERRQSEEQRIRLESARRTLREAGEL